MWKKREKEGKFFCGSDLPSNTGRNAAAGKFISFKDREFFKMLKLILGAKEYELH